MTRGPFALRTIREAVCCLVLVIACCAVGFPQTPEQININTASADELMRLPFVGRTVASRIIEYRRIHGAFKRPQEIIVIKGLNAKRYRMIAPLIRI